MSQGIRHVIFDTDPGVDDAMALAFALAHPRIELVGITTVFGNVYTPQATANALYLTQLAGRNIPVAQGALAPLKNPPKQPPAAIHGADGLGNLPSRFVMNTGHASALSAAQFIVSEVRSRPGEIDLVPVGPLTNIALALAIEPELPRLLRSIVLMGGAVRTRGNVSPVAEANAWGDPHAADAVFCAGFDLRLVGLDVTYQVITRLSLFERMAAAHKHAFTDTLVHAVRFYSQFYATRYPELSQDLGCFGHDVLAFVALLEPQLLGWASGRLRCVTDGIAQGQTILHERLEVDLPQEGFGSDIPLAQAAIGVDAPAVSALIEQTLMRKDWLI